MQYAIMNWIFVVKGIIEIVTRMWYDSYVIVKDSRSFPDLDGNTGLMEENVFTCWKHN